MMKKFILLSCIASLGMHANAQDFSWANRMGGDNNDYANSVAVDHLGNVYVTGNFIDSASFDPAGAAPKLVGSLYRLVMPYGNPAGNPQSSIFLVKYDAQGKYVWGHSFSGRQSSSGAGVAVDTAGNVYITGTFTDTVDFNPGTAVNNLISKGITASNGINTPNAFLAKYTTDGEYLWAKNITSNDALYSDAVAVDESGNAYITGNFSGVAYFDPNSNTVSGANGSSSVFLTKYDKNGNYIWVDVLGGGSSSTGYGIALSRSHVFLTGIFSGTQSFDPQNATPMLNNGGIDAFLAKYDTSGKYNWAINIGGPGTDFGYSVAVDEAENAYLSGRFQQTIKFDPAGTAQATSLGSVNIFLAKYDSTGKYVWAKGILSDGIGYGLSTALDAAGNPYITGYFGKTVDFNPGGTPVEITANGTSSPLFVAKYKSNGDYMWAESMGEAGFTWGDAMAVDRSGNAYICGHFGSNQVVDFDPGPDSFKLTSVSADGYVLKLLCNDTSSSNITISECKESYTLNGIVYTTSGTYTQKIPNASGCDSTITLNLTFYKLNPVINIDHFTLGTTDTYATYQWIKDGALIPGATDSTYTVTSNGNYQVVVTNRNGCSDTSDVYSITNYTGITNIDFLAKYIRVYPNPATDVVNIQSPVKVDAILTDITGRTIRKTKDAHSLSVKDLDAGIYLLQVIDKKETLIKVEKIVKQ